MTHLNVVHASTLLEIEQDQEKNRAVFTTGVKKVDEQICLWRGGRVIGLGVVKGGVDRDNRSDGNDLLLRLITTHLFDISQICIPSLRLDKPFNAPLPDPPPAPSLFIITPPNTSTVSDAYILFTAQLQYRQKSMQHTQSTQPPSPISADQITSSIFERVNILPYLDLTGLAESISETTSSLTSCPPTRPNSNHTSTKKMVLIQGLSPTLSTALRSSSKSSSLVRTAALLTNILRSLRRLATDTTVMVLVELDVGVNSVRSGQGGEGSGLESGFADGRGRRLKIEVSDGAGLRGGKGGGVAVGVVLERILEHAMDGIVVVHDGFRDDNERMVVEVMKDGLGDELGNWAVWDEV